MCSSDLAATWTDLGVMISSNIGTSSYLGNGIVIIGSDNGHILRSEDYGLTWTDLGVIDAASYVATLSYLGNGVVIFADGNRHIFRSDISYKLDESQVNWTRNPVNVTASRALNTTYTNSDPTRTIQVIAGIRSQITAAGGTAYAQGKASTAAPPVTIASPISGVQACLS